MTYFKSTATHLLILGSLCLGLAGCDSDDNPSTEVQQQTATVSITVLDDNNQPVQNAVVKIADRQATTNAQGKADIAQIATARNYTVSVSAAGYTTNTANLSLNSGQASASLQVKLTVAPTPGAATLRVFDAATGQPLGNATISTGNVKATSDAAGDVSLAGIMPGRTILTISANGYADQSLVVNIQPGQTLSGLNAQLIPMQIAGKISAATGGEVRLAGTAATVNIAPNSLVRADGNPIVGQISVGIALIDTAQDVKRMPGDLATTVNNQRQPLESFGAMTIKLTDESGAVVGLKNQSTANVRIPVMTKGDAPATVPLYYYDNTLGYWVVDPVQVLRLTTEAGQRFYTGTVNRFNTINADIPYQTVNVSGCLQDESGARLKNAIVTLEGIDYSGYSTVTTNSNGEFVIPARTNSEVIITGQQNLLISNTVKIETTTTDTTTGPACLAVTNAASNVKIRLTWGNLPEDVDSHLFTPSGYEISFMDEGSLSSTPFANLDVDDTDGNGPEIVTIRRLMVGNYRYIVNNYSRTANPGMTGSPIRVELNTPQGTQIFVPNAGEVQDNMYRYNWHAFNLKVDAQCHITIEPVRQWLTDSEASEPYPAPSEPVYCTPAP